jgi:hypothetical protein
VGDAWSNSRPILTAQPNQALYLSPMPPPSSQAREQKISELSLYFANDHLSLEDLERRIERVYKAATVAELEEITADLRVVASPPVQPSGARLTSTRSRVPSPAYPIERARIFSIMGEARRQGRWQVPQRLEVVSIMSDTQIDLTHAVLPSGLVEFEMRVVWAACKVIVPPGTRVVNEMHAIMASVQSSADDINPAPDEAYAPTIRLTGMALMAEVKVLVRRREDPLPDEEAR